MCVCVFVLFFFFQAEDGIRDLVRSRGLGDVYKRQVLLLPEQGNVGGPLDQRGHGETAEEERDRLEGPVLGPLPDHDVIHGCLLYTSDAADERSSVDLGGRRFIKKKNRIATVGIRGIQQIKDT